VTDWCRRRNEQTDAGLRMNIVGIPSMCPLFVVVDFWSRGTGLGVITVTGPPPSLCELICGGLVRTWRPRARFVGTWERFVGSYQYTHTHAHKTGSIIHSEMCVYI